MEKTTITLTVKPECTPEIKTKITVNVLNKKRKMFLFRVQYNSYENMYEVTYHNVEE